jgi:hypothetical protein
LVQRAGITSQKDEELKVIGVDLHDYVSRNGRGELLHDERCHAGLSDLVFIGKVLSIVDIPGPFDDPLHSKVNVLILEMLRGPKQQYDTMQLLGQGGGIVTDVPPSKDVLTYAPKGATIKVGKDVSTDARYRVGETSVYFAVNIDGHPFLSAIYKSTLPNAIQKYPNPSYFVMSDEKFEINVGGHIIPHSQGQHNSPPDVSYFVL